MTNVTTGESRGTVSGASWAFNAFHRIRAFYVRGDENLAGKKSSVLILSAVRIVLLIWWYTTKEILQGTESYRNEMYGTFVPREIRISAHLLNSRGYRREFGSNSRKMNTTLHSAKNFDWSILGLFIMPSRLKLHKMSKKEKVKMNVWALQVKFSQYII